MSNYRGLESLWVSWTLQPRQLGQCVLHRGGVEREMEEVVEVIEREYVESTGGTEEAGYTDHG